MKIYGINKVVGDINRSRNLYHHITLDKRTGEIWSDKHIGCNSWSEWHSREIVVVGVIREGIWDNYQRYTRADIVAMLQENGYEYEPARPRK